MKKTLLSLFFILWAFLLNAQFVCNTKVYPNTKPSSSIAARTSGSISANEYIVIPVVVHVLENASDPTWAISDTRICSQITALNENFTRTNADFSNTPAAFQNVAGNPNLLFYLAQTDANGNSSTGITRHSTTVSCYDPEFGLGNIKSLAPAWDRNKYLNIWIANFCENSDGTTAFGVGKIGDGIYVRASQFGVDGSTVFGKIAVHEIGHWLGLKHIWGNNIDITCAEDDGFTDTPPQYTRTFGNGGVVRDGCTTTPPGVMYCNYMNYNIEPYMTMFTQQQVNAMRSAFNPGGESAARAFAYGYAIAGNSPGCGSSTFSIPNILPSAKPVWSSSNTSALAINSTTGVATHVGSFNGEVTITAQLGGCNGPKLIKVVDVGAGMIRGTYGSGGSLLTIYNNSGSVGFPGSGSGYFNLKNANDPNATYTWSVVSQSGSASYSASGPNATLYASNMGRITVQCRVSTSCGAVTGTFSAASFSSSFRVSTYPNPATDQVSIEAEDKSEFESEVVNVLGEVVKRGSSADGKVNFYLNDLSRGVYFLRSRKGSNVVTERIFIQSQK
jgi:hypothetical protein